MAEICHLRLCMFCIRQHLLVGESVFKPDQGFQVTHTLEHDLHYAEVKLIIYGTVLYYMICYYISHIHPQGVIPCL